MDVKKVFEKLAKKGMLIVSSEDFKTSKVMLLKNMNDEVVFRFKLVEGETTLQSLQTRLEKFKSEVESCFDS